VAFSQGNSRGEGDLVEKESKPIVRLNGRIIEYVRSGEVRAGG